MSFTVFDYIARIRTRLFQSLELDPVFSELGKGSGKNFAGSLDLVLR